jgi:hypothetical protein
MPEPAQILVRHNVDLKTFREEIIPAAIPTVLKDLVAEWPVVRAGRESPRALADFIRGFDHGRMPNIIECPPSEDGRLFYRPDMTGLNFTRYPAGIGATLDRLLGLMDTPSPPTVFIESMITNDFLPDFAGAHAMPLLDPEFGPRIWIGNRVTVQTHFDLLYNIACVVGGRRRFTLFPPGQVSNLYPGPIDFTPAGTPVSMVPLRGHDATRFPRFEEALRHAQQAELTPGDALYIPYAWWHHVESLTPFNALINYWWNTAPKIGSPYAVLLHAGMSLRDMPPDQRAVWHHMFEHFIFTDPAQSMSHLAPGQRGLMGPPSAERMQAIRSILAQTFSK